MKTLKLLFLSICMILLCSTQSTAQANYSTSAGVRAAWGLAVTGKKFINDNAAIEGIVNYRRFGYLSSFSYRRVTITGLYQHHEGLDDLLPGLSYYYGGGAFVGFYGGSDWDDFTGSSSGATYVGVVLNGGLDYSFEDIPLNISVDWMPGFAFSGYGNGFGAEQGGIAVRYILN